MERTAIIPSKKNSVRLKNKNFLPFGDSGSLIEHKIACLSCCKNIDRIVVGSDSDEILSLSQSAGAEVLEIPAKYCRADTLANKMIANLVESVETDLIIWAHCTNPLIKSSTYDRAIDLLASSPEYDSLFSVRVVHGHFWYRQEPLNFKPLINHTVASELEPIFEQDGGIFIQPRENMIKNHYYYGNNPIFFEIKWPESIDIDYQEDYLMALHINDVAAH